MRLFRLRSLAGPSFVIAAAAVLAAGAGAYWNTQAVAQATGWVSHTHRVQAALNDVASVLKDIEAGQRGYLLTGQDEYLEPYRAATLQLGGRLDGLQALTSDNPRQQERLRVLRELSAQRVSIADEALRLWQDGDTRGALQVVGSGRGRQAMEAARAELAAMGAQEQRLLDQRIADARAASVRSTAFSALATTLVLALLATAFATARRDRRRIMASEQSLRQSLADAERTNRELAIQKEALRRSRHDVQLLNEQLEQRVAERTRQLSEANQELEAFSYTVSHDLRAPLRGLQGFAQAVNEDYGDRLDEDGRQYLDRIIAAARRMESLIQDLLDYGRLAREALQLRTIHLSTAITEALARVAAEVERRRARIAVQEPLPAVMAHPAVLVQVIANLLDNAMKFVRPGTVPNVRVRAEQQGERVRTWVEDEGIGIQPEHQERIFHVFERLHGQESYPGTGVGLAIVRKGCERMGGRCGVESTPGSGSRFWFELAPVRQDELRAEAVAA